MTETVLVVNAGSSSIKFQLFSVAAGDQLERRLKGQIEGVGVKPHLIARGVARSICCRCKDPAGGPKPINYSTPS